jgi:hypothetical protein
MYLLTYLYIFAMYVYIRVGFSSYVSNWALTWFIPNQLTPKGGFVRPDVQTDLTKYRRHVDNSSLQIHNLTQWYTSYETSLLGT